MLPVGLDVGRLKDYDGLVEPALRMRIRSAAERLAGLRVVHINATPFGGGVAEILKSLVPMMRDLGLEASWFVLDPDEAFFDVTKKLHNGLQGKRTSLSPAEIDRYWRHNELAARQIREIAGRPDVLVLHDGGPDAVTDEGHKLVEIRCRSQQLCGNFFRGVLFRLMPYRAVA